MSIRLSSSPPIFTEGAAVSVTADIYTLDLANHDNTRGAYFFEFKSSATSAEITVLSTASRGLITDETNANNVAFLRPSTTDFRSDDGPNYSTVGLNTAIDTVYKLGVIYDAVEGKMQVCRDGVWGSAPTYDGAYDLDTVIRLFYGQVTSNEMRTLRRYDLAYDAAKDKIDELMA